jgi:hypothetical protein
MLDTYATNAQNMASSVSASISAIKNAMNGISSISSTINTERAVSTAAKAVTKAATKKAQTAGKSHSGMELGYIGEENISNDKKAFEYIALSELKDDEIVRVLQKGEAVLTENQVFQTMDNFRKLAEFKTPTLSFKNTQPSQSIEFKGDIVINNPVGDSSSLARAIKQNLGNQVLQELYK